MALRFARFGRRALLATAGASAPFLGGCAGTLDAITSQHFKERPFHTIYQSIFESDDPAYVLLHVEDGNARAHAMLLIEEPKKHGKSDEQQNEILQTLAASATSDMQLYCRLNAIKALGRFDDPRAASLLVAAYRGAGKDGPDEPEKAANGGLIPVGRRVRSPFSAVSSFTPDNILTIQCGALEGLGKKRTPEAFALLCEVAAMPSEPAKKEPKPIDLASYEEGSLGQDRSDLRLAALRALENFKKDPQAAQFLFKIMTTERATAIKSRAHLSLMAVTGKDYEPKSPEWATVMR